MSASQDARQVLLEISLLPGGATQNFNPETRSGGEAVFPAGDGKHLLIRWAEAFAAATWEELPALVIEARAELQAFKRGPDVKVKDETWAQLSKRIADEGAGWDAHSVSLALKVTPSQARKAYREHGLHPDTGLSVKSIDQLRKEGKSIREISRLTGVAHATVQRRVSPAQ